MTAIIAFLALGFGIGVVSGATGIGGGTLLAPALMLFAGLDPFVSVGTDLFVSVVTKAIGARIHQRANSLYREILKPLCIFGVIGAILGAVALYVLKLHVNVAPAQLFLRHAIGIVLFVCAAFVLLSSFVRGRGESGNPTLYAKIVGLVVGAITTITGVGVGSLTLPSLHFISSKRPLSEIVGTTLVFATFVTAVGAAVHMALGDVDYKLSLWLLIGGIPGVVVGSAISLSASRWLRPIIVVLLIVSAYKLVA
jgi:uncharacterized membrane protein YfcA